MRENLLQFRNRLIARTLRCCNEDVVPNIEHTLRYRARAADWYFLEEGAANIVGKVGSCARDMVSECRRCSRVVCRVLFPTSIFHRLYCLTSLYRIVRLSPLHLFFCVTGTADYVQLASEHRLLLFYRPMCQLQPRSTPCPYWQTPPSAELFVPVIKRVYGSVSHVAVVFAAQTLPMSLSGDGGLVTDQP